MENPDASLATDHAAACRRVAALFAPRWLRHYAVWKLRADGIFRAAAELLRASDAPLLDVGCGVGLLPFYLRERGFSPAITGLDVDARKILHARQAVGTRHTGITFLEQDAGEKLPFSHGNVTLFDLLHYLPLARQEELLHALAAQAGPGDVVLIRDCPSDGTLRYWATYAAEIFAQTISWNLAVRLHFPTRASINAAFGAEDFKREERPMYGSGPFNNRLFIFRRRTQ